MDFIATAPLFAITSVIISLIIGFYVPHHTIKKLSKTRVITEFVTYLSDYERENRMVTTANVRMLKKKLENEGISGHKLKVIESAVICAIDDYDPANRINLFDNIVDINEIDSMTGVQFEQFLKGVFQEKGYGVSSTKASGNQGVDLILRKQGRKIAIQAKRYKNKISNSAVQEISAGKIYHDCNEAYVVTNSYFTQPAIELAGRVNVRLIDRTELMKLVSHRHVDL